MKECRGIPRKRKLQRFRVPRAHDTTTILFHPTTTRLFISRAEQWAAARDLRSPRRAGSWAPGSSTSTWGGTAHRVLSGRGDDHAKGALTHVWTLSSPPCSGRRKQPCSATLRIPDCGSAVPAEAHGGTLARCVWLLERTYGETETGLNMITVWMLPCVSFFIFFLSFRKAPFLCGTARLKSSLLVVVTCFFRKVEC